MPSRTVHSPDTRPAPDRRVGIASGRAVRPSQEWSLAAANEHPPAVGRDLNEPSPDLPDEGSSSVSDLAAQQNRRPQAAAELDDLSRLVAGSSLEVSRAGVFRNPDGDAPTITAGAGDAVVIVCARDSDGASVFTEFDVSVVEASALGDHDPLRRQL